MLSNNQLLVAESNNLYTLTVCSFRYILNGSFAISNFGNYENVMGILISDLYFTCIA